MARASNVASLLLAVAPVAMPSSFVLSAEVSRPVRDVVAAAIVASVPVSLVMSSVSVPRFATARFVDPDPPVAALSVVPVNERFVPRMISSIAPVDAVLRPSSRAVDIVMPVDPTAPVLAPSVMP